MLKKNLIIVIIAFILSLFLLSIFINPVSTSTNTDTNQNSKINDFYSNFDSNQKSIFILGSSHVGRFNHMYIEEQINNGKEDYVIFNLSINGDFPENRLKSIEKIVLLKPDLILYGVSHWEFANEILKSDASKPKSFLPDPAIHLKQSIQTFEEILGLNFIGWNSAKSLTINLIKNTIGIDDTKGIENLPVENLPFNSLRKSHTIILDELSLKRSLESKTSQIDKIYFEHENTSSLRKIINIFQQNEIPVILFSSPVSDVYLNTITNDDQRNFEKILADISKIDDVSILLLHDKFRYEQIWNDPNHLAYNTKSNFVYHDLIDMIKDTLKIS